MAESLVLRNRVAELERKIGRGDCGGEDRDYKREEEWEVV